MRVLIVEDDHGVAEQARRTLTAAGFVVDLARKYGVALVPTAVAVTGSGAVLARLAG